MINLEKEIAKCDSALPINVINIAKKYALLFLTLDNRIESQGEIDVITIDKMLKSEYVVWLSKQYEFNKAKEKLKLPVPLSTYQIKSMDEFRNAFFLEWMLAKCLTHFTEEHASQTVINPNQIKKIKTLTKELTEATNGGFILPTKREQYALNNLLKKTQFTIEPNPHTYQKNRGNVFQNLLINSLMRGIARAYNNKISANDLAYIALSIISLFFEHKDNRRVTTERAEMIIEEIELEAKL